MCHPGHGPDPRAGSEAARASEARRAQRSWIAVAERGSHPREPGYRLRPGSRAWRGRTGVGNAGLPAGGPRPSGTIEPMTVPGRVEAASLLLSLDPLDWQVRHARAVGEVAGWLAARISANGIAVDRRLAESAALLHDVDKILPPGDPVKALPHGDGSAAWLTQAGHPELSRAVANHPVTWLLDGDRYRKWAAF